MNVTDAQRPIIVLGAGGHAKVVIDTLLALGRKIAGIADSDPKTHGNDVLGVSVLGGEEAVEARAAGDISLANGVGSTGDAGRRKDIFERFRDKGYEFVSIVHPSAIIAAGIEIKDGAQIMAGAIIQPDCRIGENAIINTGARVDHDGIIGDHAHVAPGAVLGGTVSVGAQTHIGAGATVIQNIKIGTRCLVAAGAVVTGDIADGIRVSGVPAQPMDGTQT